MLNKSLLRGHVADEWFITSDGHITAINPHEDHSLRIDVSCDEDSKTATMELVRSAPDLLAEHDVLCELVDAYAKAIDALEYVVDIREIEDGGAYDDARAKITTLRGRLKIE